MSNATDDPNRGKRTAFRALGALLLLVGVFLLLVAIVDFFGAMSSDDVSSQPTRFWMAFVGLPLIALGGWLLQAGFLGATAGYVASETAPAVRRTSEAWSDGANGPYCRQCGKRAAADAKFCDSCGTSLA